MQKVSTKKMTHKEAEEYHRVVSGRVIQTCSRHTPHGITWREHPKDD